MTKYTHLKKLIDWTEQFENQLSDGEQWDDRNFANWLSGQVNASARDEKPLQEKSKSNILVSVYFMYKYALFYSRKVFKNSQIYSIDDFSFLASLLPDKKLKKADVIRKNVAEKSSGNEVLKRLLKQKLIQETNNPNDKRSKLLELTLEGFKAISTLGTQMHKVSSLVNGNLTEQEKITMLNMLSKLQSFHKPLFEANDEKLLNERLGILE